MMMHDAHAHTCMFVQQEQSLATTFVWVFDQLNQLLAILTPTAVLKFNPGGSKVGEQQHTPELKTHKLPAVVVVNDKGSDSLAPLVPSCGPCVRFYRHSTSHTRNMQSSYARALAMCTLTAQSSSNGGGVASADCSNFIWGTACEGQEMKGNGKQQGREGCERK